MVIVSEATSPAQLDAVRTLMRAFIAWHRERHTQDLHLIDAYFDADAFERELARLPGDYVPLLLASVDGEAAGCVALHATGDGCCEMKRMFVYPRFHGRGVGHALAGQLIEQARAGGYRTMCLDTSIRQAEALALYTRLGFRRVASPDGLTPDMRDWLVFMELALQAA